MQLNMWAAGRPNGLADEIKTGWATGVTAGPQMFVHCNDTDLRNTGLSNAFSREWCTFHETALPILGGRVLFAFPSNGGGQPPIPPPVKLLGFAGFMYVFTAPAGTQFACQGGTFLNGQLNTGKEVAFPYSFLPADLQVYDLRPAVTGSCCVIM